MGPDEYLGGPFIGWFRDAVKSGRRIKIWWEEGKKETLSDAERIARETIGGFDNLPEETRRSFIEIIQKLLDEGQIE